MSAATWSTLLAVGAALGGFVTDWFGTASVFVIDSATYLVSAWFLFRTVIPQQTEVGRRRGIGAANAFGPEGRPPMRWRIGLSWSRNRILIRATDTAALRCAA